MIYLLSALGLAVLVLAFIGQRAVTNAYRLLDTVARRVGAITAEDLARPMRGYVVIAMSPLIGALVLVNMRARGDQWRSRALVSSIALGAARSTWDRVRDREVLEDVEDALDAWVRG